MKKQGSCYVKSAQKTEKKIRYKYLVLCNKSGVIKPSTFPLRTQCKLLLNSQPDIGINKTHTQSLMCYNNSESHEKC